MGAPLPGWSREPWVEEPAEVMTGEGPWPTRGPTGCEAVGVF